MKFRQNLAVKILSIMAAVSVLASCGSAPSKVAKNSTSNEFLQKVQPKQTVISCGKQNRYGHPHLETIHRLQTYRTKIYRTDRSGAIIFFKRRDG